MFKIKTNLSLLILLPCILFLGTGCDFAMDATWLTEGGVVTKDEDIDSQEKVFVREDKNTAEVESVDTEEIVASSMRVESVAPSLGCQDVAIDSTIKITFSEPVFEKFVYPESIKLQYVNPSLDVVKDNIPFVLSLDNSGQVLQIVPQQDFIRGETVQIVVACDIKNDKEELVAKSRVGLIDDVCFTSHFFVVQE